LIDLGCVSGSFGTFNFPLIFSLSKTRERFDAIDGGLEVSVALGDPGIGASCMVCRFEAEGYLGCMVKSLPEAFFAIVLIPLGP
jgi:hypothetical protein